MQDLETRTQDPGSSTLDLRSENRTNELKATIAGDLGPGTEPFDLI